jgi:CRISPR-associated protein Csd1
MIIQALVSLYDRLAENQTKELPTEGYAEQRASFAIVLGDNGKMLQLKDLRTQSGKKLVPEMLLLPSIGRSGSGFFPQFMWDNTQYVLGAVAVDEKKDKPDEIARKQQRALEAFESFRDFHHRHLDRCNSPAVKSFLAFLDHWKPEMAEGLENWKEVAGANIVFMHGNRSFIHEEPEVRGIWEKLCEERDDGEIGFCLLTGERRKLARLHPMMKNVDGAQATAAIVSFNKEAFCSYGKEQSYNAPLGPVAAFKYTAALNYLLRRTANPQRMKVGDSTTIFWTKRASPVEEFLGFALGANDEAADATDRRQVELFLTAVRQGTRPLIPDFDGDVEFYILGLAPNSSRLAVRFWYACTVAELMKQLGKHFGNLEMERCFEHDPLNPGIWELLKETARETKDISPVLGGELMRSILEGVAYPMSIYHGVLNRIRVENDPKRRKVSYLRAAILKAVLTRNYKMEVPMSLDKSKTDIGYLMGRLFAVLEKAQSDALGNVNATIKDRFWGAASSTPASVFPRLLNLGQHHIAKAQFGIASDNVIREIMESIPAFPARLSLQEQGMFAIGYYQQRNDLYRKNENKENKGE